MGSTKHIIKFLAICTKSNIVKMILNDCSNDVIKSICNATLNSCNGEIALSPKLKALFQQNKKSV